MGGRRRHLLALGLLLGAFVPGCEEGAFTDDCSGAEEFLYQDKLCGLPPGDAAPLPCEEKGDGRCYRRCDDHSDCNEKDRPYCTQIGLYNGGDWNCNEVVYVCRERRSDYCKR